MKFGRKRMEKLDLKSETLVPDKRGHTESERWKKRDEKRDENYDATARGT